MPQTPQDPKELESRAFELYKTRLCPHCGNKISLWEAVSMVHGSDARYFVKVRHVPTGREMILDVGYVNPKEMVILHPKD